MGDPTAGVTPGRRLGRLGSAAAVTAVVAACSITGCASAPPASQEPPQLEYLKAVERLEAQGAPFEPGSEAERRAIERFQALLGDFKAADFRQRIREVYAEEVFFDDTLKTVRGLDAVEAYLVESAGAVERATVEFVDLVASNGNYYLRWAMTIRFARFARGEEKRSVGMTHLRFDGDGRVVLHQDFWDSARGLWDHVPAIGWLLRRAKSAL